MSMKRSRRASNSSRSSHADGPTAFGGQPAPAATWAEALADKPDEAFKPYALSTTFARSDLVAHSKFGRGVVTLVEGNRIEILFEDGARKLGHAGG